MLGFISNLEYAGRCVLVVDIFYKGPEDLKTLIFFGGSGFLKPIFHRHQRTAAYHFLIFNRAKLSSISKKGQMNLFLQKFSEHLPSNVL